MKKERGKRTIFVLEHTCNGLLMTLQTKTDFNRSNTVLLLMTKRREFVCSKLKTNRPLKKFTFHGKKNMTWCSYIYVFRMAFLFSFQVRGKAYNENNERVHYRNMFKNLSKISQKIYANQLFGANKTTKSLKIP